MSPMAFPDRPSRGGMSPATVAAESVEPLPVKVPISDDRESLSCIVSPQIAIIHDDLDL